MDLSRSDAIDLAHQLANDFASRADEADKLGCLPEADVRALRESGYLALSIPREYGGAGLSMRDCLETQVILAQGSASTALVAGMPLHMFGHQREYRTWSEEAYEHLCQLVVKKGALLNSIASEPVLGSPSRGGIFVTTADPTPDDDGWIINGHKTWSTGGRHLTHMLVRVSLQEGTGVVLVEQGTSGVRWQETWGHALSLRASDSHDVLFKNVQVPPEHLIERQSPDAPKSPENAWFPMVIASVYLGAALAARDDVIRYALERVPTALGRPIATLPKIQRQIGELDAALQAAKLYYFDAAQAWTGRLGDREQLLPRIVAAKHLVVEMANTVTQQALEIAGGISLSRQLRLERHFRDVRAGLMQLPSGETALEILGQAAIKRIEKEKP